MTSRTKISIRLYSWRSTVGKRWIAAACRLVTIGYVYTGMFVSIWRTRHATPLSVVDSEFALRFFLIVLTDAVCWAPIILLKILALAEYPVARKSPTIDTPAAWPFVGPMDHPPNARFFVAFFCFKARLELRLTF
jgi:hypothetical protein